MLPICITDPKLNVVARSARGGGTKSALQLANRRHAVVNNDLVKVAFIKITMVEGRNFIDIHSTCSGCSAVLPRTRYWLKKKTKDATRRRWIIPKNYCSPACTETLARKQFKPEVARVASQEKYGTT